MGFVGLLRQWYNCHHKKYGEVVRVLPGVLEYSDRVRVPNFAYLIGLFDNRKGSFWYSQAPIERGKILPKTAFLFLN